DPTAPVAMRKVVEETSDEFVRGHARYRLARTLLAVGEPEQALAVLREYLAFDRNRTALDAEALLHYGDAAATLGALREAREAYTLLLTKMAAPPRNLVRIAQQRV